MPNSTTRGEFVKNLFVFLFAALVISSGLYNNRWGVVGTKYYKYWQQIFEFWVVGRLNLSNNEGIFSSGGLLVIGGVDELNYDSKVINAQYKSYYQGNRFNKYWVYKSSPAIEGIIFSVFDRLTNFSPGQNLKIFRLGVSITNGLVFAALVLWLYLEFGVFASALVLLFINLSPWMVLLGGSIYWQLWVFYLPLVAFLFILRFGLYHKLYPKCRLATCFFVFSLIKILFSGFEFITTFLVMMTVPFIYYAVKNLWKLEICLKSTKDFFLGSIGSVVIGLLLLTLQISFVERKFIKALEYIWYSFGKRSFETGQTYAEPFAAALRVNVFSVIKKYLAGPALDNPFAYTSTVESTGISFQSFIILFFIVSILLIILKKASFFSERNRLDRALVITVWYSILAPISWLIVFKAHAAIHVSLDFMIWQMPFMLFGIALVGYTISQSKLVGKAFGTI